MHPVWPVSQDAALFDSAATRAIEAAGAAGLTAHTLMDRAGLGVARLARALAPHAQGAIIWCGPGNNGGDGFVAARHLHLLGWDVQVCMVGEPAQRPPDAQAALSAAQQAGVALHAAPSPDRMRDDFTEVVHIDAMLGLGASRAPSALLCAGINAFNAGTGCRLAVDLPSGLNADTGCALGAVVARATHTLSLLTLKPGLFTAAGRDFAGQIWFDDLGVAPHGPGADALNRIAPSAWLVGAREIPHRLHQQHKGSFGDVWVIGGAAGMAGAALLAGRSALVAGAGRVFVHPLADSHFSIDPLGIELMLRDAPPDATSLQTSTVVAGCGGGKTVGDSLPKLLQYAARLVLDADALNALAADPQLRRALIERSARGQPSALTPHPLEAARLLGCSVPDVQANRQRAAQQLADELGCVVVLKGSGTVMAAPGATPRINSSGNAALASPGTGDVLAGYLGGRWSACGATAHAASGQALNQAFDAAQAAVWMHGHAAEHPLQSVLSASGLIDRLRA